MYQNLHYPTWETGHCVWIDAITDTNNNDLVGVKLLRPVINFKGHWNGQIKASIVSFNPFSLKYPENTNIEGFDVPLDYEGIVEDEEQLSRVNHELFAAFKEAEHDFSNTLGLEEESHINFWFSGAGVTGEYLENEDGYECWDRFREEHPALDFLYDLVKSGEYQEGLLNRVITTGVELPDDVILSIDIKHHQRMNNALGEFAGNTLWGLMWQKEQDEKCATGFYHTCRQHSSTPVTKGKIDTQTFMREETQKLRKRKAEDEDFSIVDDIAIRNFETLLDAYTGDNAQAFNHININPNRGSLLFAWAPTPHRIAKVELDGEDIMTFNMDWQSQESKSKFQATETYSFAGSFNYDAQKLVEFINTGKAPTLDDD